ncbi:unnamed protein product [Heterobilharzia americana]|nr:unnamed protein product [Heterobilharzia americana]
MLTSYQLKSSKMYTKLLIKYGLLRIPNKTRRLLHTSDIQIYETKVFSQEYYEKEVTNLMKYNESYRNHSMVGFCMLETEKKMNN